MVNIFVCKRGCVRVRVRVRVCVCMCALVCVCVCAFAHVCARRPSYVAISTKTSINTRHQLCKSQHRTKLITQYQYLYMLKYSPLSNKNRTDSLSRLSMIFCSVSKTIKNVINIYLYIQIYIYIPSETEHLLNCTVPSQHKIIGTLCDPNETPNQLYSETEH